jgi:acyl-CoA synthetase (AMP-forming)/AMP-acid ligase II
VGEIQVSGPSLMQGYDGLESDSHAALRDGWLRTGDLGFLHDGELYLSGRKKDVIVLRGRNHAPQDLEQSASQVAGVRTGCCAAVGLLDPDGEGEQLVLFVERARDDASTDLAERVGRHVLEHTGLAPSLVRVLEPGTLPRTSSGKIRRSETRRLHLLGALDPPKPVHSGSLARAMTRSVLAFARMRLRA